MAFPGVGGGGVLLSLVGIISVASSVGVFLLVVSAGFVGVVWVGSLSISSTSFSWWAAGLVGTCVLLDFLGFFFFSLGFFGRGDFFLNFSAGFSSPLVSFTKSPKMVWSLFDRRRKLSYRNSISLDMDRASADILARS